MFFSVKHEVERRKSEKIRRKKKEKVFFSVKKEKDLGLNVKNTEKKERKGSFLRK